MRVFKQSKAASAMRYVRGVAIAAAVIIAGLAGTANAAPPSSCKNPITACGCVIDKNATKKVKDGIFTVANDLDAAQSGALNCIEIAEAHTVLNVKGHSITGRGDGTGIGILIRHSADHVVVAGGDASGGDAAPAALGSEPAVIAKWDVGIQDDGDYAAIELFSNLGGFFEGIPGNNTGLFLSHVKNSAAFNFHADINNKVGVMLDHVHNCRFSNYDAGGNDVGVMVDSSDGNRFDAASMMGNRKVGIWLLSSSNNALFDCNGTEFNVDVGILLGCGPEAGCSAAGGSDNNRISSCGAKNSGIAGILVDQGNRNNIITVTHNTGNPANADMVDNNPNCGTDLWYNNEGTGNQSCVLLNPK